MILKLRFVSIVLRHRDVSRYNKLYLDLRRDLNIPTFHKEEVLKTGSWPNRIFRTSIKLIRGTYTTSCEKTEKRKRIKRGAKCAASFRCNEYFSIYRRFPLKMWYGKYVSPIWSKLQKLGYRESVSSSSAINRIFTSLECRNF